MLFNKFSVKNKKLEVRLVDAPSLHPEEVLRKNSEYGKNSPPIVEEGITLSKSDILTAVVVLTLVNGVVAMGVAKIAKGGE